MSEESARLQTRNAHEALGKPISFEQPAPYAAAHRSRCEGSNVTPARAFVPPASHEDTGFRGAYRSGSVVETMSSERYKVLMVEDNPADRFLYRISLPEPVFETVEAENAAAGLEACKRHRPDCILLDFNLPALNGLEFIAALRNECGELPCAIVMITGVHDERVAVEAMKSGATDYIPKTDNIGDFLQHAVISAVEKFRMARQIEQQRAELEANERQYRALMEAIPQLVWITDAAGAIHYANSRWSEYVGGSPTDGPTELDHVIFPEDRDRYDAAWQRALAANSAFEIEIRLQRVAHRSVRWHLVRVGPMAAADANAANARWLGTATDIEDLKQAERAIQQKQKWESIGLLAGGIAHDFNNLLVGILGGASYVADSLPEAHPVQSIVSNIVRSAERAAQLTRQMLAYAGKGQFFIEQVDLSAVVRETCELIRSSIPDHVRLAHETADDLPMVETDSGQMQQLVMNLVINAAEAIPAARPGVVRIRTFARQIDTDSVPSGCANPYEVNPGTYVVLEVEDNGSGMDEPTKQKIFDPFFTTKFTGRGLGLAAVQGILRSVKGCIIVESEPGKGSLFRVFLPASKAATLRPEAERAISAARQDTSRYTILVIDDEDVVCQVAASALERAGFTVLTAADGATGLRMMREHPAISLVLLDMGMPEMNGREVLAKMRGMQITVPVVICSGYSEPEVMRQFAGYEFAGVISKPFKSKELPIRVREILESISGGERGRPS